MSNPAPDSSQCRAAAPRFTSTSAAAPRLHLLQLLHSDCVRFSCCSPLASASSLQLLPDCICFSCCTLIASTSAAARRLHPLQAFNCSPIASASATAPRLRLLPLLLPDCVCFNGCSPIVSALTAAAFLPLVAPAVLEDSNPWPGPMFSTFFAEFEVQVRRSRITSLVLPPEHPTSLVPSHITHRHTHTH